MRNLFALVGAGTIAFVGLGWYLDWYKLTRQPSGSGTQRLAVDLNSDKITGDVKKGIERGGEIIDHIRDNGNNNQQQPAPNTQPADQGPATQFFTPPSSTPTANGPWKSLDNAPPLTNGPARIQPPNR